MARPLSQEDTAPTLVLTGFYCFSGHNTLRMVLITMHRFTLGSYRKQRRGCCKLHQKVGYLQMEREKWLNWLLSSLEGLA